MSQPEPTANLVTEFSEPTADARPWAEVSEALSRAEMFWLSTVRADGRPHVAPLPGVWLDGELHFCTGAHEQKAMNLRANANCALSTGPNQFREGLDVVVEGHAVRVTDRARLERLAASWRSKFDWAFDVTDDGFHDPDHPDGKAIVFGVAPAKVLAFGKSPYSQTRYHFAG